MKRLLTVIASIFLIVCLATALTPPAAGQSPGALPSANNGATITSDKPEYAPGDRVTLIGSGFAPNELVTVVLCVTPETHAPVTLAGISDASGNFKISDYVVQQSDLGVTFSVQSVGSTGDRGAPFTFKDTIGTPTSIGTLADNGTNTATQTISVTATVPVGNTVIVSLTFDDTSGGTTVTATDTHANTYTSDANVIDSQGTRTIVFSAPITTALSSGNSITMTLSASRRQFYASAFQVSGLLTPSAVDKTATSTGTSASASVGPTATTTQAGELVFAALGLDLSNGPPTFTAGASYTALTNSAANNEWGIYPEYQIVSATGAFTATGSWAPTGDIDDWAAAIVTFKGGTAPPTIAKAFSPATIALGSTSGLTITLTNPNTSTTLTGVGFTDGLPSGMTQTGVATNCTSGVVSASTSTSIVLSGASIAGGGSCTVTATVTPSTAGNNVNTTGTVSSTNGGTGTTAAATLFVVAPPTITKAFAPTSVSVSTNSVLTINITNPAANTAALAGVGVVDNFPSGLVVAGTPGATNTCGGTFAPAANATSITLSGGSIAIGSSCAISVNVDSATVGTYVNLTGNVTSSNGGSGTTASATLTVTVPPSITKVFTASTIALNASTTMTLTITNPSATQTQTGLAVSDTFPAGLTVASTPGATNTCGGTFTANANASSVSLTGGSLAVSSSCALTVSVTGTTTGSKTNTTGAVTSTNGGTGNTGSATIVVMAPPTITKSFAAASMAQTTGSTTLTLTISNPATNTAALTGVAVTDNLPSGMTQTGVATTCNSGSVASSTSTSIVLSGATIAANGSCTVTATVSDTTSGVASNTTGAVSSANGGTGLTANATIAVEIPPTVTKAFAPAEIAPSGTSTLTITITNPAANTVALTGVAIADALPSGVIVATPNGASTTCTGGTQSAVAGSGTVSLTSGSINAGTSCNVIANVTAAAVGSYVNTTGTVSAANGGTGGTATATLTVAAPPTITKSFTNASIPAGGTSTLAYTITNPATNAGAVNGIAVTDTFPAGMTVASTPNLSNTCGGTISGGASGNTTLSLSGGSIATPGATCTVSVSVTSTTAGNSVNTTGAVSSTNYGTGTTATATLNVVAPPTITKAFAAGAAGMPVNGTSTMTITITNPTANTVAQSGVSVSDTFPSGMTISTAATTTCSGGTLTGSGVGSGTISLSSASIPTSSSCTITASVTDTTAGTATNTTGAVSSTNGGTGLTASASLIVNNPPTVSKTFSPTSVGTGVSSLMTITITNPDTVTLTGVTISDTFPGGLVVQTPNGASTTGCTGGTLTATAGSGSISLSASSVAVGTPCVIKVNVTSATANTYVNTTNAVTSTNGGTGLTASATLTVTPIATVTAIAVGGQTPGSVGPGSSATYAITTTWTGPGTCTSAPLTINWTPAAGETAAFSPTTVSNSSTTTTLTISTTASTPTGSTNFTVTVASTGGTGQCGTGSVTSSTQTFAVATATINAANVGSQTPNPVSQGSSATFPITSQWSGTGLGCTSNPLQINWVPPSADTTATFNPPTVSSGSTTSTLTITTFADTPPSTTSFTVTVSNNLGGGCSSNNSVLTNSANLVVSGNASPSITKSFTPANIAPSNPSTLTLVISASAADLSNLTNVSVSDPFPSGMQVASTPAATNSCTTGSTAGTFTAPAAATTISYSGATIAPGGSCTLTVNVTASTSGKYVNTTGTVTAGNVSVPGNSATATLTIFGAPTHLVFGTQPSNTAVSTTITPAITVQVEDAQNNVVTNSSASITMAISTNPGNGSLNGTLTQTASSGIATFPDLSINRIANGYILTASSSPLTSATSNTFNIVQPADNYTEPFNTGHGWTYTQVSCSGGTCTPATGASTNVTTAADCQVAPCVAAASSSGDLSVAQTMTGYYHNPAGYTWQTIGVPAGATVNTVQGSWWDLLVAAGAGCNTAANTVTAGMHIYNSANTTEITSSSVFADTSVTGDVEGATHGPGSVVNVTATFAPSSTPITLRFDINPSVLGNLFSAPTCTIYGDSYNLLITYTPSTGGRRGQVIIGFNRMPNGDFQMTKPVLVSSTQDRAEDGPGSGNVAILSKRTE